MNEVMFTAEDLDIKIFYQDTDNMHIEKTRLKDLSEEYKHISSFFNWKEYGTISQ